jgi:hypothetical protein
MKIRKQVYELTLDDLERSPVWEFALDEEGEDDQDEATVQPYQYSPPLNPNEGMFIVRANFILTDGTSMEGYLTPPVQGQSGISTFQPTIINKNGQVGFWYGIREPDEKMISENYRLIGKDAVHLFPIKFRSTVEVLGGPIEGILEGFMFFKIQDGNIANRTVEVRK